MLSIERRQPLLGEHGHSDRRQDSPGAPELRYARGRGFAYQVAMATCLVLIISHLLWLVVVVAVFSALVVFVLRGLSDV
jgi:hypothetical protein